MLNLLREYKGKVKVNGMEYESVNHAITALKDFTGKVTVEMNYYITSTQNTAQPAKFNEIKPSVDIHKITVKQYMTKPATADFDFHKKWNGNIEMPLRTMVGKVLKETKGMIQMELWGEITDEITTVCMKCGRALTNPVSQYFGIGPECGGHNYVNPFETKEELKHAVNLMKQQLTEIRWTGWIIKSAILEDTIIRKEVE